MPGLAKVGRTARDPSGRATELSGATGVPTPFIVAYQHPVSNCEAAERWVHEELEQRGQRASERREFFSAPLHEIVEIVRRSAQLFDEEQLGDLVAPGGVSEGEEGSLAEQLMELALAREQGTDTALPDSEGARALAEQAAALGHAGAEGWLGDYYARDASLPSQQRAIDHYLRSVQLGHRFRCAELAMIFQANGRLDASAKYWNQYFEAAVFYFESHGLERAFHGRVYVEQVLEGKLPHCVPDSLIAQTREPIFAGLRQYLDMIKEESSDEDFLLWQMQKIERISQFVEQCCSRVAGSQSRPK